jgi:tRNA (guanine26-N2/guanine27-N2)-dimethyltransferase
MSFPQSITAPPAADQHVVHEEKEYITVKEGLAYILIPASAAKTPQTTPKGDNQPQSVFYNPIQQFNRDLSVLAIKAYGEEILERRLKAYDNTKKRLAAKRDRKRKRENDGVGSESRKAGKVGDGDRADELPPAANRDIVDTTTSVQSTILEGRDSGSVTEHNGDAKDSVEEVSSSGVLPAPVQQDD